MKPKWEIRKGDIAIGVRNGEPNLPRIVTLTGEIDASELYVSTYIRFREAGVPYVGINMRNISHSLFTEFKLLWRGEEGEDIEVRVE